MAAAEHQRTGAIEGVEQFQALARHGCRQQWQADEQNEEQNEQAGAGPPADRERQGDMVDRRIVFQKKNADNATEHDRADLAPCRGHCQHNRGGGNRERRPLAVGRERADHSEHGLRHHRDRHDFQPVQPAAAECATERIDTVGEQHERQRRRQREAYPSDNRAEITGPHQADGDADLTAGRTGQKLAERHEIGIGFFIQPAPADDILITKVTEVSNRAAERSQTEAEADAKHVEPVCALCRSCRHCFVLNVD